jgi:hypothetical protein
MIELALARGRLSLLDHRGVIRYDAIYDYC